MLSALKFLKERVGVKQKIFNEFKKLDKSLDGCVCAVDGGSCIIADGGSWLIAKLKVASVYYDKGKRVSGLEQKKQEYYTIIKSNGSYEHSIPYLKPEFPNIKELTETPSTIMRSLEFKHAYELVKTLPKNSLLLIDGLLQAETPDQEKIIKLLELESRKQGVNVVGLAKTFRKSINGQSIIGSLLKQKPDEKWLYSLDNYSIVKLHNKASFAYALSYFKHININEVLPILTYYSTDPALIGYPYPLLKVDQDARISSHEKKLEVNKLKIIAKREGLDFIEYDQKCTSMHSVMDSQKYR